MANKTIGIGVGPAVRPQLVPTGKPKVKPVPTGKPKGTPVPTGKPKVKPVPTGKPKETPFLATEDEGIFDSGCSRSMTGNKERLDDFYPFHGGKVTFGGGEGRITGKGTIRTPTLDFENVYYVKELQQFNLFSISQICDKKNQVLFTDTECLVLSKDFKLPYDNMVVLKVPRKHNLYTINLNDLCPRGNLACLVAHASFDESVKWNRQMAHVNYKNRNRLVKGNLVTGLPPKLFKNGHTCVACCKGKRHKASYKAINAVSSIFEPLQLLYMDLFGPTSIRSIDHKYYCLVITDDNSYKHVLANQPVGTHGATTNSAGTQDADSDSDSDEQVIIVPSYPLHSIQGTQPIDTPGDKVDDSPFHLALGTAYKFEDLQTPPSANSIPPGCIPVPTSKVLVPTGSLPVPTGSIPVPAAAAMVPTDDVPVHSSSSTDSMFVGKPTTRFPCPSDLRNHNPSPGIFSSSSFDDEFDTALNNVAILVERVNFNFVE
nr:putative ribonuclease H-like domain-containing protein [Tanacetum cinerariifolium]